MSNKQALAMDICWVEDKRILFSRMSGNYDANGLRRASQQANHYLSEGAAPVHLVFDVADMHLSLYNLDEIEREMPFMTHPSLGCVVFTGSTPMLAYLGRMLARRARARFCSVRTLEDAFYFLSMQDGSL